MLHIYFSAASGVQHIWIDQTISRLFNIYVLTNTKKVLIMISNIHTVQKGCLSLESRRLYQNKCAYELSKKSCLKANEKSFPTKPINITPRLPIS